MTSPATDRVVRFTVGACDTVVIDQRRDGKTKGVLPYGGTPMAAGEQGPLVRSAVAVCQKYRPTVRRTADVG